MDDELTTIESAGEVCEKEGFRSHALVHVDLFLLDGDGGE